MADVFIILGCAMLLFGLYLIAWPLVLVAAGAATLTLGLRV